MRPEWLDYNGHLNDASYAIVLTAAHELLLEHLGLSADYRASHQASMFTVEMHLHYLAEVSAGQTLTASTVVVGGRPQAAAPAQRAVRRRGAGRHR